MSYTPFMRGKKHESTTLRGISGGVLYRLYFRDGVIAPAYRGMLLRYGR
jgi:hypothetical protein